MAQGEGIGGLVFNVYFLYLITYQSLNYYKNNEL
jgi:hypothetical protein